MSWAILSGALRFCVRGSSLLSVKARKVNYMESGKKFNEQFQLSWQAQHFGFGIEASH